jgi:hypothetical protein
MPVALMSVCLRHLPICNNLIHRSTENLTKCLLVGQMSVGQMSVGQMSVGQMSVGQMSVGQMSIGQMSVGQISVGQMSVGQLSIGQMSVSLLSVSVPRPNLLRPNVCRPKTFGPKTFKTDTMFRWMHQSVNWSTCLSYTACRPKSLSGKWCSAKSCAIKWSFTRKNVTCQKTNLLHLIFLTGGLTSFGRLTFG